MRRELFTATSKHGGSRDLIYGFFKQWLDHYPSWAIREKGNNLKLSVFFLTETEPCPTFQLTEHDENGGSIESQSLTIDLSKRNLTMLRGLRKMLEPNNAKIDWKVDDVCFEDILKGLYLSAIKSVELPREYIEQSFDFLLKAVYADGNEFKEILQDNPCLSKSDRAYSTETTYTKYLCSIGKIKSEDIELLPKEKLDGRLDLEEERYFLWLSELANKPEYSEKKPDYEMKPNTSNVFSDVFKDIEGEELIVKF